jgi:hypothetical protein
VKWDVALDQHRVAYVLYAQPQPFDFAGDPRLKAARRIPLFPSMPADYRRNGVGRDRYPYEATVSGLSPGEPLHLLIRAVDDSPAANEDANTTVRIATP